MNLTRKGYCKLTKKSERLYKEASNVLPAGVSYFIRYFEPYPFYINWAKGSKIMDVDGNKYVDFWLGHYTHILGHSPQNIVNAVKKQLDHGTHYGVCHEIEVAMAKQITKMVPCAEMVRFTNSGTEAAMYAIRLARAYTRKDNIVKFEGGWHGGYDALHIAVGDPIKGPESAGITKGALKNTVVAPFNDLEGTMKLVKKQKIAAIIVEPVQGAGGCIPANREFLLGLREFCSDNNTLLIFDEIITGFRLSPGGAQQYFGVLPDVAIFGKILGGGFPVGAISGKKEIMELMNPLKFEKSEFCFQGGTFTANPVTLSAGLEMLRTLEDGSILHRLNREGEKLQDEFERLFSRKNVEATINRVGSLFKVHFTGHQVNNIRDAAEADHDKLIKYHMMLIEGGVFFLPGKNGALCNAHSDGDLARLIEKTEQFIERF